jgi:hypothetical protein
MVLPATLRQWLLAGKIHGDLVRDSWKYVNLYLIGQARELRRKKARWLALRLLTQVNMNYLDAESIFMTLKTLILLFLPTGMKRMANELFLSSKRTK